MKLFLKETVYEAALNRIRWLYSEFPTVYVDFSGGKDSTVLLNLTLKVAEELGRLPVPVVFIDQEAEWQAAIDYIRVVMHDPRVEPHWLQVPIKLFNATSPTDPWLLTWEPGKEAEWMRPKEPDSIHENAFGTDRFAKLFHAYTRHRHGSAPICSLSGVRAEESPNRWLSLTGVETYKGETWGRNDDADNRQFSFYPLYDWSYTDIWKAIHDNGWPYTRVYDWQYQHGVPVRGMRVSNLHHETAVHILFMLQQMEPATWNRLTGRLRGINTAGQMQKDFYGPRALPAMFKDWKEYRDHLLENLAPEEHRPYFRATFARYDVRYDGKALQDLYRAQIGCILVNDYHGTKLGTFRASHFWDAKTRGSRQMKRTN